MSIAELVGLYLSHYRLQGLSFIEAWSRCLHAIPRGAEGGQIHQPVVANERQEWVEALRWSRPAWQAAYERRPVDEVLAQDLGRYRPGAVATAADQVSPPAGGELIAA